MPKTQKKDDVINDYMYRLNNLSLRFHNNIKYLFTLFYHACMHKIICHVMEGYEPISTILIAQVVLLHVDHFINGSGWTTKSNIQVIQVNSLDEILLPVAKTRSFKVSNYMCAINGKKKIMHGLIVVLRVMRRL